MRNWSRRAPSEGRTRRKHPSFSPPSSHRRRTRGRHRRRRRPRRCTDPQVVAAAAATGRLLITLDRGLGDIRAYPPGSHAGILVLRASDQSPPTVAAAPSEVVAGHNLTTLTGTVTVAQPGLLRIRHLP
ncbi:DUF5615 family PIN-like protein [Geodermatophilus sp. DSM 44513]|uniref:DUF5615 family PIN-like protein n=1 Tax=Geodermatophilus sp. DSM 44513 TaxID=1528104 RepID=UPI0037C19B9F